MKKIISWILAIVLLFSLVPVTASAATYSGVCGDNLTWNYNDETGVLLISGTGDMYNWSEMDYGNDKEQPPWYSFASEIRSVYIDNGATSIGDEAFIRCHNIININIPEGVTRIGLAAFMIVEAS